MSMETNYVITAEARQEIERGAFEIKALAETLANDPSPDAATLFPGMIAARAETLIAIAADEAEAITQQK